MLVARKRNLVVAPCESLDLAVWLSHHQVNLEWSQAEYCTNKHGHSTTVGCPRHNPITARRVASSVC